MDVTIDEKKGTMTIVMPLQKPTASASGKTMVVATTHGNQNTGQTFQGKVLTLGLNAYYRP